MSERDEPLGLRIGKRTLDLLGTTLLLLITAPFLLLAALAIVVEDRGPVLYRQTRVGRYGVGFELLKLRTMIVGAEYQGAGFAVNAGDPRITRVGRLLRRLSFDELPQLLNVLRGDMSLVGPRPMMVEQQDLYPGTAYYALRPGITGFWQTSVRNESSFAERAGFDTDYLRHHATLSDHVSQTCF